jgi:hypothetical protein
MIPQLPRIGQSPIIHLFNMLLNSIKTFIG